MFQQQGTDGHIQHYGHVAENGEHKHQQTHQPHMIDEQHPAAVAMSPYTASRKGEGHISKVTNEIAWFNLEERKKNATHIKLGMYS